MTAQVTQRGSNFRTSAASAPRPSSVPGGYGYSPYRSPPSPANQNWRPPPPAANQNFRIPPGTPNAFRIPGAGVLRFALRVSPWIIAGITAYELYQIWKGHGRVQGDSSADPGWTTQCVTIGGGTKWGGNDNCGSLKNIAVVQANLNAPDSQANIGFRRYYWNYGDLQPGSSVTYEVGKLIFRDLTTAEQPYVAAQHDPVGLDQFPIPAPFNQPMIAPHVMPELDPFALPINQPLPRPMPLPWQAPRPNFTPGRSPQESTVRGPRPRPRPRPDLNPRTIQAPGVAIQIKPGHTRKPPRKNEKEQKWSQGVAGSWPSVILNGVTEANDFVSSIWNAIPKHIRTGGSCKNSLICMAQDIYNHAEHIDAGEAMKNLAANALEDAIAGRGIGALQNAAVNAGLNPGAINPGGKMGNFW